MHTENLVLIGTLHSDPLGYARTRILLSQIHPDLIFVELSPYALHYRKENARHLLREFSRNLRIAATAAGYSFREALLHSSITAIRRQIVLPFEYRASEAYASRAAGVGILAVDWSEFSRQWIQTWEELISRENIQSLLREEMKDSPVHVQYEQAANTISGESPSPDLWTGKDFPIWQNREEHITTTIRSALLHLSPRRPVYIGGWRHLIAGGPLRTVRNSLGIDISHCFLLDRGALRCGALRSR